MSVFHPAFPMKVFVSKGKTIGQLLLGFPLLALFVVFFIGIAQSPNNLNWRATILMYLAPVGIVLIAGLQVFFIRKLLVNKPFLEVDEKGIDTGQSKFGFFRWEDLMHVRMVEFQAGVQKIPILVLVPRDVDRALASYSGFTLYRAKSSMKEYKGLMIMMQGIAGKPLEVAGAITEYAQQQIFEHSPAPPISLGTPTR